MAANSNYIVTTSQENAIEELRRRIGSELDAYNMMDTTFVLYRFLKARNWDINKAETMLRKAIQFVKRINIKDLVNVYKPPEVLRKYFSNFLIGYDKEGCFVLYIALGKSDPRGLHKATKPFEIDKAITQWFCTYEIVLEQKMKRENRWLSGFIIIFDMNGLNFSNATCKKGLEVLIRLTRAQQERAPERLKALYFINGFRTLHMYTLEERRIKEEIIQLFKFIKLGDVDGLEFNIANVTRASTFFTVPFNLVKSFLNSETQKKFHVCGAESWKDELLKMIDADQLPAFMGGTRTDPDGNPLCKTFLNQMGTVDESYYLAKNGNPLANSPGVKKLLLLRASSITIPLQIRESGSAIEWEFETKIGDVGFGLFYKKTDDEDGQVIEVVSVERVDTKDFVESGICKCEKPGEYFALFDNSYSWLRSKELFYRIRVLNPRELEDQMKEEQFCLI